MKRKLSIIVSAVLLVCMVLSTACSSEKKDETKYNFGKELLTVASQLDALNGLKKGDADIAVIDSVMAGYYMNDTDEFKDYETLQNVVLAEEKYGIAAKKGNVSLMSKINEAIIALADTDYKTVADTYGLTTELLVTADTENPIEVADDVSWDNVAQAGKIVIGYTLFAPIAYNEGDGENAVLKGFDIDLAKAVINYLNKTYETAIEIEFMVIDWNSKEALLENGTIDLVWNGMTITDERVAAMEISVPYLANKQVAIIAKKDADKYKSANYDEFVSKASDAVTIVEKGSAGESVVLPSEE